MNCSGVHRGFGVHISFIRSIGMDSWSDRQLKSMSLGGNKELADFFAKYDLTAESIHTRYLTKAAEYYRQKVSSIIN